MSRGVRGGAQSHQQDPRVLISLTIQVFSNYGDLPILKIKVTTSQYIFSL